MQLQSSSSSALFFLLPQWRKRVVQKSVCKVRDFFTRGTTGNGTEYSSTESGGFLGTYRYHLNRWISAEAAYGYDVNTQRYSVLSSAPFRIQSGIHQFAGSLVLNLPSRTHSRFNPYVIVGGGALLFDPTSNQLNTLSASQSQTKGTFVYGAGLNYAIRKGIATFQPRAVNESFLHLRLGCGALS